MAQMTDKQFRENMVKTLLGLAGNFGDTFDAYTLDMWRKMFKRDGISLEQIDAAAIKIMRSRKISKMPTYAEFLEYIQGSPADKAQQQADMVIDVLRTKGRMVDPIFPDTITAHLMRTRWPYKTWAAEVKESELVWWRKEFIEAYKSYSKNPDTIPANRQLEAGQKVKRLAEGIGG